MTTTPAVLRVNDVAQYLNVSTSTIWGRIKPNHKLYEPEFPKPFKLSSNTTAWLHSEVQAYLEAKAATRTAQTGKQGG